MMRKMIVTGSEGFIGKALCRELVKRGVEVIGLDRKCGTEATEVCELLKNRGIDCVFHLAAQTSVFNGNLEQIRKDNIDTFMRVVDACNLYRVKLVYASSSTANPVNTTSMYGISKYFDEQYASIYCKTATGCRLHNVYSPNHVKELFSGSCLMRKRCHYTIAVRISGALLTWMMLSKALSMQ